jgi:hypothetical protein
MDVFVRRVTTLLTIFDVMIIICKGIILKDMFTCIVTLLFVTERCRPEM